MNKAEKELVLFVIAFLLPPVAAHMKVGLTKHFYINLVLTLLFFVPGMFHALWLVLPQKANKKPVSERHGPSGGKAGRKKKRKRR